MITEGHVLTIPMPGHPVPKEHEATIKKDYDLLDSLIDKHDVIFLLTDSRENRWLPTVITQAKNKLCMNVALGFDTYVALRHGCSDPKDDKHEKIRLLFLHRYSRTKNR
eukprot:UN00846